jgi:hypothetical protein
MGRREARIAQTTLMTLNDVAQENPYWEVTFIASRGFMVR